MVVDVKLHLEIRVKGSPRDSRHLRIKLRLPYVPPVGGWIESPHWRVQIAQAGVGVSEHAIFKEVRLDSVVEAGSAEYAFAMAKRYAEDGWDVVSHDAVHETQA